MNKRIAAILAVLVAFAAVVLYGITQANTTASADAPKTETGPVKKIDICHFTSIHANHPYVKINISAKQIVNGNGHGGHVFDIWPSFQYKFKDGTIVTVPAHGNQSIYENDCKLPGQTPPVTPCPTVTTTVTATVTVTAQPNKKTPSTPPCSPTPTATATVTTTTTTTPNPTETVTATATTTVTAPTATVTVTATPTAGPFVPSTGCPPPNLFNAIRGNHRNNAMVGTPCRDVMAGHGGNDVMFGAAETDIMLGQRGNDALDGGTGVDAIRGGFGNDVLRSNDGTPGDRLIGGLGRDLCIVDPGDIARQCERVIRG